MPGDKQNLRERNRARARSEIAEAALRLFAERGFEGVTVEDIVTEAGVSRRTFFRYFDTKEDALLADYPELTFKLTESLTIQPSVEGASAVELVRAGLHQLVEWYAERGDIVMERSRILRSSINPAARNLEFLSQWEKAVGATVAACTGEDPRGLAVRTAAAALVGAFRTALTEWVRLGCEGDLHVLTDRSIDLIAAGLDAALAPG